MTIFDVRGFDRGYFIGNFTPSVCRTAAVEVGVKSFKAGAVISKHRQRTAWEYTVVLTGEQTLISSLTGTHHLRPWDLFVVAPGEIIEGHCTQDTVVVVVKLPSQPDDHEVLD